MLYTIIIAYTEFTNYCCRLLISLEFCFKACAGVRLVQKHRLQDVYATVLQHCQSAADQSCSIHQRCTSVISSWHQSVCQRWAVQIFTLWTRASRLMGSTIVIHSWWWICCQISSSHRRITSRFSRMAHWRTSEQGTWNSHLAKTRDTRLYSSRFVAAE